MKMLENGKIVLSYIIPALNEEKSIGPTLDAIMRNTPSGYSYQVIVVDNGSSDHTADIVNERGAILLKHANGTIALCRNRGAARAAGKILVFLDADVCLTRTWRDEIMLVIPKLLKSTFQVTGSRCNVQDSNNWLARYWFLKMRFERAKYINSGHLITTRTLFWRIGGFTEELKTGEDYDFAEKAKSIGAKIVNNPNLLVIHTGYPRNLRAFITRERWHGSEDFMSLRKLFVSKVGILAVMNVFMLVSSLLITILTLNPLWIWVYGVMMLIIAATVTLLKFGVRHPLSLLISTIICYFYITGRSLSFIDRIKSLVWLNKQKNH